MTASGISVDLPYATSMNSTDDKTVRVTIVNVIAAILWGFLCLVLFSVPFVFPAIIASIVRTVAGTIVPDVTD